MRNVEAGVDWRMGQEIEIVVRGVDWEWLGKETGTGMRNSRSGEWNWFGEENRTRMRS